MGFLPSPLAEMMLAARGGALVPMMQAALRVALASMTLATVRSPWQWRQHSLAGAPQRQLEASMRLAGAGQGSSIQILTAMFGRGWHSWSFCSAKVFYRRPIACGSFWSSHEY